MNLGHRTEMKSTYLSAVALGVLSLSLLGWGWERAALSPAPNAERVVLDESDYNYVDDEGEGRVLAQVHASLVRSFAQRLVEGR